MKNATFKRILSAVLVMLMLVSCLSTVLAFGASAEGTHKITVKSDITGGTAKAMTEATAGYIVVVSCNNDNGYHFDGLTVTTASGKAVETKGTHFVMPDEDVTVTASYSKLTQIGATQSYFDSEGNPLTNWVYIYDQNGYSPEHTSYKYEDGNFIPTYKYVYSYNKNGDTTEAATQEYKDGQFTPKSKSVYSYKDDGSLELITNYNYTDGTFVPSAKYEYTVTETTKYYQSYNYTDGQWVKGYAQKYVYDDNGKTISCIAYNADGSLAYDIEYEFDSHGNQTNYTKYNSAGEVSSQTVNSYDYDNIGNITAKHTSTGTTIYTYDSFGYVLTETDEAGTYKNEYQYDKNGNQTNYVYSVLTDGAYVVQQKTVKEYSENSFTKSSITYKLTDGEMKISSHVEYSRAYAIENATPADAKGSITVASSSNAGETVEIAVTPKDGCHLKKLTYNDGTEHELTANEEGKFVFTMPYATVTVNATFAKDFSAIWIILIILFILLAVYAAGYFFCYREGHMNNSPVKKIYAFLPAGKATK